MSRLSFRTMNKPARSVLLFFVLCLAIVAGFFSFARADSKKATCYASGAIDLNGQLVALTLKDTVAAQKERLLGLNSTLASVVAVAYRSDQNTLYAAIPGQLGTVDLSTAELQLLPGPIGSGNGSLGEMALGDVRALAFDPTSDVLYAVARSESADLLTQIDTMSGQVLPDAFGSSPSTYVLITGLGAARVVGIAIDPLGGQLYALADESGVGFSLLRVDKTTGIASAAQILAANGLRALSFDANGQLFALAQGDSGNVVYEVDALTGALSAPSTLTSSGLTALSCESGASTRVPPDNTHGRIENELIVRFAPGISQERIDEIFRDLHLGKKVHLSGIDTYLMATPPGRTQYMLGALQALPEVEYADYNYVANAAVSPSDPDYLDTTKVYAPQLIGVEGAWDFTIGSPSVVVAVVDSGVSANHPELIGRVLPGYDYVNNDSDASDDNGHGTHIAGTIAAAMNGQGMVGIAPNVQILPVKVLSSTNAGTYANIASGIIYATDHGARIINLSLGGAVASQVLLDAVRYANDHGVLVVAAMGNSGYDSNITPFYPAYWDETLAVSASTAQDVIWSLSNYGSVVDVAAPGETIWSTEWTPGDPNAYAFDSGTSMAASHVSGLAALLMSFRPELSATDVRALIQQTATDKGAAGSDQYFGHGRINADAALTAASPYWQRVNAGYTTADWIDGQSQSWLKDKAYTSGSWGYTSGATKSSNSAVAGTNDDFLYQKYRDGMTKYEFTVPNGQYHVKMRWAEFAYAAGKRKMLIKIEGVRVEGALDIAALVGKAVAYDKTYTATVQDGVLTVEFAKNGGTYSPMISGIEIVYLGPPPPTPTPTPTPTSTSTPMPTATPTSTPTPDPNATATPTPIPYTQRANTGTTSSYTDQSGRVWAGDRNFTTGSWGYSTPGRTGSSSKSVANTDDDKLYQKYRELAGFYKFTVPNGTYQVKLRMAEFSVTSATARATRITIEGVDVETKLSIYGLVGSYAALDRMYTTTVSDGILDVQFSRAAGASKDPAISGIEVQSIN